MKTTSSNRKNNSESTAFVFSSGAAFADKDEYIEKTLTFSILAATFEPGAGFEGQDRWAIHVLPNDDRGEELITLQSNPKRDEQMRSAQSHIETNGPIGPARLKKSGNTFYFENVAESISK